MRLELTQVVCAKALLEVPSMPVGFLPPPAVRSDATSDIPSNRLSLRARRVGLLHRLPGLLFALLVCCLPMRMLAATATPSVLTCSPGSATGVVDVPCVLTLTAPAPRGGVTVSMSSNNGAVTIAGALNVASGATSAQFDAAVIWQMPTAGTATLTATLGSVSTGFTLQLLPEAETLTASGTSLTFGSVPVNTAATQSIVLSSTGNTPVTIESVRFKGAGFALVGGNFPLILNPGTSTTVNVQFEPTAVGSVTGKLTIDSTDNSGNSRMVVNLSGTGISGSTSPVLNAVSCTSGSLTGAGTNACTVTLTSAATSATTVTLASSSSAVTVPASVTIASGATSASFTATATAVSANQTATLTATAGGVSKTFALTLNATTPTLTLSASSVAFGTDVLNTAITKTVTLTSSGTAALTLTGATVSGTGFADSGISFPVTLNPGQTATLTVSFDPTAAGSFAGSVSIASNAATATISLSGTGQSPATLSAVSCSSGSLTGAGTDACTVTLTSAATSATTVTLASSSSAVTVPASVTIASGATSASFTATATAVSANQTATLTAAAGGVSKTFALTLNATTPTLTLSASSVAFGSITVNTAATQSVTMTSSGTGSVTVSAGSVSGTGFTLPGAKFPVTLNPGQTSTIEVQFDPTTAGAATGTVALSSNCSMGAMTVALSGTGAAAATYQVGLSWDAPASSSDPVAGYHIYRATSGGSYQLLQSSVNVPTTYTDTTVQAGANYNYEVTSVDASGVESTPSNVYSVAIP